ncbi:MAG TPA: hypothetical protein VMH03_08605, partial [Terriglobales bacterium]|nr:hypothetical protein [Terriglobales bacterium]
LVVHFYNEHGSSLGTMRLANVDPTDPVSLETEVVPPGKAGRVSLHVEDENGMDRGSLEEVQVSSGDHR